MSTTVKGIKYGTLAQYKALAAKDPDTLYFITDKGLIFRGESIVIPTKVTNARIQGSGASEKAMFTIETYTAGQTGDNLPKTLNFSVYTHSAINEVVATLNRNLNTHRIFGGTGTQADPYVFADGKATGSQSGHVTLTDTVDMATPANNAAAASGGTAVTPKGVYDAINAVLPGLAGAMQFKGTLASAADMPQTYAVGEVYVASAAFTIGTEGRVLSVESGDMLIATTTRTTASNTPDPAHWAVVEQNLTGAVTAAADLAADALVLGNGSKTAKTLANGSNNRGKHLRQNTQGQPEWMRHAIHHTTCTTATATFAKAAATADGGGALGVLVSGTLAAVRFTNHVDHDSGATNPVSVTLNIDGTGAHIVLHKANNPIVSGAIHDGDTALFIYDATTVTIKNVQYNGVWRLLAVDHMLPAVALSGSYNDLTNLPDALSCFGNDLCAFGTCPSTASENDKYITLATGSSFSLTDGAVLMVKFAYDVRSGSVITIADTDIRQVPVYNGSNNAPIEAGIIAAGDVCTFIVSKSRTNTSQVFVLVGIHRPIDTIVTADSTNLVTSGGVAAAITAATGQAINKRNYYGVCNTAASTAAKQAIGVTAFELNTGAIVTVKFTNAVTASGATLALSSNLGVTFTDPKYIYYGGQLLATDVIEAGDICTFMYNGAQFELIAFAREGLKWDSLPPEPVE